MTTTCSLCEKPARARGWCSTHYHAWWQKQRHAPRPCRSPQDAVVLACPCGGEVFYVTATYRREGSFEYTLHVCVCAMCGMPVNPAQMSPKIAQEPDKTGLPTP